MIKQLKMKKLDYKNLKRIIALFLIALTMIGCKEDNSIERRITKAMKGYVQKNFDNPKAFKEIAEIELSSVIDLKRDLDEALKNSADLDSLYNCTYEKLFGRMKLDLDRMKQENPKVIDQNKREQGSALLMDLFEWSREGDEIDLIRKKRNVYYNDIETILTKDTLYPISLYDIKVRVRDNGQLKLKTYYTWICDTTQTIKISNEPVKTESFEKEKDLMEKCKKLVEYDLVLNEYIKRGESIYNKIVLLLN